MPTWQANAWGTPYTPSPRPDAYGCGTSRCCRRRARERVPHALPRRRHAGAVSQAGALPAPVAPAVPDQVRGHGARRDQRRGGQLRAFWPVTTCARRGSPRSRCFLHRPSAGSNEPCVLGLLQAPRWPCSTSGLKIEPGSGVAARRQVADASANAVQSTAAAQAGKAARATRWYSLTWAPRSRRRCATPRARPEYVEYQEDLWSMQDRAAACKARAVAIVNKVSMREGHACAAPSSR